MQRVYYLIFESKEVTLASQFYQIMVPDTTQGERDLLFLQRWAADNGCYMAIRSQESSMFMLRIAESLNVKVFMLPITKMPIRQFVTHVKRQKCTPVTSDSRREAARLLRILYPADYFLRQINVIRKAEAYKRNKPKSEDVRIKGSKNLLRKTPSVDGVRI